MFMKFVKRLAILGLAFLVSTFLQREVGPTYFFIDIGWTVIQIVVLMAIIGLGGALSDENAVAGTLNFLIVLFVAILVVINLALAGIISWIFNVDFYIAYIVFDFILCLIPSKKKDE